MTPPGAPGGPDLFIPISMFHEAFCADLPAEIIAATMAVSQRPVSAAAFTENATAAGWKTLPSWYMVSEQDNAIPPDCERFMAKRANATVESVSGGSHTAFIAPSPASRQALSSKPSRSVDRLIERMDGRTDGRFRPRNPEANGT
jgi:hypothetical protein